MPALPWVFEQTTAKSGQEKKSFTLSGPNAPFGRPRQKAIVADGLEIREKTVYYPDNNVPTRHVFGPKWDDWELNGRFRDVNLGPAGAAALAQKIQEIVSDGQQVQITWGHIISSTGLIKKFTPKRESPSEIVWEMRILIDSPVNQVQIKRGTNPGRLLATVNQIASALKVKIVDPIHQPSTLRGLLGQFVDTVETLVSTLNSAVALLVDVTGDVTNFASAIEGQIQRIQAAAHQVRTVTIQLRNTFLSSRLDFIMFQRDADSDIRYAKTLNDIQLASQTTLALLQELDNQADLILRQQGLTSYTAKFGDSWESISIKFYGGPQGASKIRDLNGISYSDQPIPGNSYAIPR